MTLKEILKCWKSQYINDSTHTTYHIPTLENDLAELLQETFITGLALGHDRNKTITELWNENKERFLGK